MPDYGWAIPEHLSCPLLFLVSPIPTERERARGENGVERSVTCILLLQNFQSEEESSWRMEDILK
jgi:hypothetical protein